MSSLPNAAERPTAPASNAALHWMAFMAGCIAPEAVAMAYYCQFILQSDKPPESAEVRVHGEIPE